MDLNNMSKIMNVKHNLHGNRVQFEKNFDYKNNIFKALTKSSNGKCLTP